MKKRPKWVALGIVAALWAAAAVTALATDGSVKDTTATDNGTSKAAVFKTQLVTDPIGGKRANVPYVRLDAPIDLDGATVNFDLTDVTAAPGATPSPSPANALIVQGIAGGTALPVNTGGWSVSHKATNATTTAKSGAGVLHAITINTKGASSNTITVYDNTAGSGTVMAVIDSTASVGTLIYDASFATGLTVVTATGTAPDITVTYR